MSGVAATVAYCAGFIADRYSRFDGARLWKNGRLVDWGTYIAERNAEAQWMA